MNNRWANKIVYRQFDAYTDVKECISYIYLDSQSDATIPNRSFDTLEIVFWKRKTNTELIVKVREVKQGSFSMISNACVHKH